MHPVLYFCFCVLHSTSTTQSSVSIITHGAGPLYPLYPPNPALWWAIPAQLSVSACLFFIWLVHLFHFCYYLLDFFLIFHIWVKSRGVCLLHFSGIMPPQVHVAANGKVSSFLWLRALLLCVCIPHLYPSVCWWTLGLLPYLGHFK